MEENKSDYLHLSNRCMFEVTGVTKLDSFNTKEFLFNTTKGYLHIKGENLALGNMNMEAGTLTIKGTVDSIQYIGKAKEKTNESGGFLKRLFR